MDFEEREQQRRRQMIKVIIAELGMVFSVIAIVIVATLAALGFFVTSDGTIVQNGLVQIHSMPTGATVELDGNVLFSHTNLSRSLSATQHTIKLSRERYDTWSKTITMSSGMLLRLYYPRLFLLQRTPEVALNLPKDLDLYVPSTDHTYVIYTVKQDPVWHLINLRNDDTPQISTLDLTDWLPGVKNEQFEGKVEQIRWNANNDRILTKVSYDGKTEWILINLKDVKQSLNLTQTFGLEFTQIEMIDNSAGQLFAIENQQLRRINTADQAISRVLLSNVTSFANYKTGLVYVMRLVQDDQIYQEVGVYRDGERGTTSLLKVEAADAKIMVAMTHYYDEDYWAYIVDDELTVNYGSLPNYRERTDETDMTGMKLLLRERLSTVPESLELSPEGEYMIARRGQDFMVLDMEMGEIHQYEAMGAGYTWLEEGLIGVVKDQALYAWDFDNTNLRKLVQAKDAVAGTDESAVTTIIDYSPVNYSPMISENGRWLYYVVRTETGLQLIRERIRD